MGVWQYFGAAVPAAAGLCRLGSTSLGLGFVCVMASCGQSTRQFASVSAPTHTHTHRDYYYVRACACVLSALWLLAAR